MLEVERLAFAGVDIPAHVSQRRIVYLHIRTKHTIIGTPKMWWEMCCHK